MSIKKGFTLVELIVVVIIVGILASVSIPLMSGNIAKARKTEAVAALGTLRTAARLYYVEKSNTWPSSMNDVNTYVTSGDLAGKYYKYADYNLTGDTFGAYNANASATGVTINYKDGTLTGN